MPLGFSAAPSPRAVCPPLCQLRGSCITPVNDLLHLYKQAASVYPSVCAFTRVVPATRVIQHHGALPSLLAGGY